VLEGKASFRVAGTDIVLGPGEVLTVPPRTPHYLWNAGDVEAHLIVEFRPGLLKQEFYETVFGLERDHKLNLLQWAVLTAAYRRESRPLNQPRIARLGLLLLAPLGWLIGYRAHYARYCTRPDGPGRVPDSARLAG
jgi:hypothetical protein